MGRREEEQASKREGEGERKWERGGIEKNLLIPPSQEKG